MKNAYKFQKGSTTTAIVALVILIIFLALSALVYYKYDDKVAVENPSNTVIPDYTATTTVVSNPVNASGEVTTETKTVYEPEHTKVVTRPASPFPGGPTYHNSTYGLTVPLPASWNGYSVYINRESYGGFPNSNSIHFNVGGTNPLTINVFTKEQWNAIRNQENANHLNVNSLGEGMYLGENFTYIYSSQALTTEAQSILNYILFY